MLEPDGHGVHVVCPVVDENEPKGHGMHVAEDVAPTAVEAVPTGHVLHPKPAPRPYVPAWQFVQSIAPTLLDVPEGHSVEHCVMENEALLNVFAGHERHSRA